MVRCDPLFDLLDYLTSNIMLPLGGLFIAIFAAWVLRRQTSEEELDTNVVVYSVWRFLVRYVTPICVILVFLRAIKAI